jgi:hypothetical protein
LLAGEFLKAGKDQVQSEAFHIISEHNKVAYTYCDPPAEHFPMLDVMSLAAHLEREAGEFLKLRRKNALSDSETDDRLADLMSKEEFLNVQFARLFSNRTDKQQ